MSMYGSQDASHIWQPDYVNLICGELRGFRRGKHSTAFFHKANQDVRMAVPGEDFCVCQTKTDSITSTHFSHQKYTAKDMGTIGFEDSDTKRLLLLNRVSGVGTDQTGQVLDIALDLRHAPLIKESGCNATTNTPPARQVGVKQHDTDLLASDFPIWPKTDETWRKQQHIWPRMSEPREFDVVPLKRAARDLVGKPKAAIRFRRQEHVDKITVFVDSDFDGDPVSRKNTTGLVAQIGNHTVKSGPHFRA